MKKDYYQEKIFLIEKMIENKEYEKVFKEIEEELKMPYVPSIYESIFNSMLDQIKPYLVKGNKRNLISKDVALEYLLSEDKEKEIMALELLRKHNLHYDKELFKKIIETWPFEKNNEKAYLFELMVEQNVDIDVNFNGLIINPSKNKSILENKDVIHTIDIIENLLIKNPSWQEIGFDVFHKILLNTYPGVPENPRELANDVALIVKSYFELSTMLSDKQKRIKKIIE